jgi:uncharacterized NAD(P)/FAD-binding protein YdhS
MQTSKPHIHPVRTLIVGAGFCGTMVATHLLSRRDEESAASPSSARHVTLINRPSANTSQQAAASAASGLAGGLARGLAYGTQSDAHLLNVPAGRMSAFSDRPDDFLDYLKRHNIAADGGSFVARKHYGAYLRATLDDAISRKNPDDAFNAIAAQVIGIVRVDDVFHVTLDDGHTLTADQVVLALGNFAPADLPFADKTFFSSSRYVRDPWAANAFANVDLSQPVLCIGTGLTMFDVTLTLDKLAQQRGHALHLIAISRHGLWPHAHREHTDAPTFAHAPDALRDPACATARAYLRAVRNEVDRLAPLGVDWRDVIASIRPMTAALWQRLTQIEKRRFLRHLRAWWDVHRHRAAPNIAKHLAQLAVSGTITSNAARILHFRETDAGVDVELIRRGQRTSETIRVGTVINCTGPSSSIAHEPLLATLAARGVLRADELRLGIEVGDDFQLQPNLFYVGPLLKARDWEASAVPELRTYAEKCAEACAQACIEGRFIAP